MASFSNPISPAFLLILLMNLQLAALRCEAAIGDETDREALLAIKAQIRKDPTGALSAWNDSVPDFCVWPGVRCYKRYQRVFALDLISMKLEGSISPYIGNLSYAIEINVGENSFYGEIPREVGNLFRLEYLNLSYNSFQGEILTTLTNCSGLGFIDIANSFFIGSIPVGFDSLSKLQYLWLNKNGFTGSVPPSLGNLTQLQALSFGINSLEGSIPDDLGRLANLLIFQASGNRLSGEVPRSLYNISSMRNLILVDNQLHGSLPWDIGTTLPNLEFIWLGLNYFTGRIPYTFPNASRLQAIDIAQNAFLGPVPDNLGGLQYLFRLNLEVNQLGNGDPNDLSFLNSLTNSSFLELLVLRGNNFLGPLPNSLANMSTSLRTLVVGQNQITGTIPTGIENLVNLNYFDLEDNLLAGTIPYGVGKLTRLIKLLLSNNKLEGEIPSSIGNMTFLNDLHLQNNGLWGSIPQILGNCSSLNSLDLSKNNLSSTLPKQVLSLPYLSRSLILSQNQLTGPIPSEVGGLTSLVELDLSRNKISGEIPSSLGKCITLEKLYMNDNGFRGTIPSSLSNLRSIQKLDLSSNELSGQVPKYFGDFPLLQYLNLSYNDFEGEVPKEGVYKNASAISILGNEKLCGGIAELKLPTCTSNNASKEQGGASSKLKLILLIVGATAIAICLTIVASALVVCYWKKDSIKKPTIFSSSIGDQHKKVSYGELRKATNEFSSDNLIGVGSHGSVYRGILGKDEKVVAVKVLDTEKREASKSFVHECKTLRNVRHQNLIKVLTVCSSADYKGNDFKALVYEYMPNGNLDRWLHSQEDGQNHSHCLSFIQRLNISIEVASALKYLHHHCQIPIAHCDLKPSNILLNNDMSAHVGDFGLARLLCEIGNSLSYNNSSSIGIRGSIGYIPPEYGLGGEVSTQGDVYSYGILLLEMFTGKRPTDDMFNDGLSLHGLARMANPDQVIEIVDPRLLLDERDADVNNETNKNYKRDKFKECLISIFKIGVMCSVESSGERMHMIDVVKELEVVMNMFVG